MAGEQLAIYISNHYIRNTMPEISRFLGIIIVMYWDDSTRHYKPHFHARYNEYKCAISIPELELLNGSLPTRIIRLVREWANEHMDELSKNWQLITSDKHPLPIKGLE
jgi:hypothetical protein